MNKNKTYLLIVLTIFFSCGDKKTIADNKHFDVLENKPKESNKYNSNQYKNQDDSIYSIDRSKKSIIIYRLSEEEVSIYKDTSSVGYAIYEVDSDFGYNVNILKKNVEDSLKIKGITFVDKHVSSYNINDSILSRRDMKFPYGLILFKPNKEIKILSGVKHWKNYLLEINKYFSPDGARKNR